MVQIHFRHQCRKDPAFYVKVWHRQGNGDSAPAAVLSDRNIVIFADAKTRDIKDEYWAVKEEVLPVLQPLKLVTGLLLSRSMPISSFGYPLVQKAGERRSRRQSRARLELGSLTIAWYPFVVATVLDPFAKSMDLFAAEFRDAAYQNVHELADSNNCGCVSGLSRDADAFRATILYFYGTIYRPVGINV